MQIEVHDVSKEMDLEIIRQNSQVERIIADRISKDDSGDIIPEYLVKWQGLSYAEVTWYITLNLVDLFFVHFLCIHCLHIRKDDG
jgi:hypothetical protein